jgi:hypothetical protein
VKEVETIFQSARIVATTCLSINNPLFEKRRFDYCIVDEASQLTLPVCLGTKGLPPIMRSIRRRAAPDLPPWVAP